MASKEDFFGEWDIAFAESPMISAGMRLKISAQEDSALLNVAFASIGAESGSAHEIAFNNASYDTDDGFVEFPLLAGASRTPYGAIRVFSYQNPDGSRGVYGFVDVSDPQQVGVFGSNAAGGGNAMEGEARRTQITATDFEGEYLLTQQAPTSMVSTTSMVVADGKISFFQPNGEASPSYDLNLQNGQWTYDDGVFHNLLSLYAKGDYRALCCAQRNSDGSIAGVWDAQITPVAYKQIAIAEITLSVTLEDAAEDARLYLGIGGREFCLVDNGTMNAGLNTYTLGDSGQLTLGELEAFAPYLRLASGTLNLSEINAAAVTERETYAYARLGNGQTAVLSQGSGETLYLLSSKINALATEA